MSLEFGAVAVGGCGNDELGVKEGVGGYEIVGLGLDAEHVAGIEMGIKAQVEGALVFCDVVEFEYVPLGIVVFGGLH